MSFRFVPIAAVLFLVAGPQESVAGNDTTRAPVAVQSQGPRGVPPRRVSRYRDPRVEPSTFQQPADAKPLLAEDWKPNEISVSDALPVGETPAKAPLPRRLGSSTQLEKSPRPRLSGMFDELTSWRAPRGSAATAASGLALVIGLVMISAWVAKKSLPRSAQPLPSEAAEVLGRLRLNGKQTAQLVRLGRKLVLIHVTPTGAEAITELTDDADVERVLAACDRGRGGSTAEFEDVLDRMGVEPTAQGFLGDQDMFDPRRLADAYANTPGGRDHA